MEKHKYNYGIIGNCAFSALVDTNADIGFMCWPRFDSSFIFGGLLDDAKGGHFYIRPATSNYTSSQRYITNTNILETIFECEDGKYKVIDFAPRFFQFNRAFKPLMLVRKVVPIEGRPRVKVSCKPVGQYGDRVPVPVMGSSHIRYEGLEAQVRLTTNVSLNYVLEEEPFALSQTQHFVLTWGVPLEAALETTVEDFLSRTKQYWNLWVQNTSTENFRQQSVIRSALTLKLHQYQDTGAIIAATTTSLPEFPGSTRNWDYRFCWFRDAHYTLKALNDLSHFNILRDYSRFIENVVLSEDRRYHPLVPIANHVIPEEKILDLAGYRGEKPVRVGNQAYEHIQNDVYGQVMLTLLPFFTDLRLTGKTGKSLEETAWHCLEMIEATMEEPDNGLWEFRGMSQLHTYTFLFHWAGSHAGKRIAAIIGDEKMDRYADKLLKASIEMLEKCYDEKRGVYTQAVGNPNLDASLLQLINMGYLKPDSPKAKQHMKVLEDELKTSTGLFYRYKHADDFGEPESTFLICAFWYVEALARMGRINEAVDTFDMLVGHGNHLGLFSEDVHEESGSQWGNFPQTYSHVGLINAAFAISRKLDKPIYF